MMKSIIKMISAFFLLSLFTILGSQARMLPAGENGIIKTISNSINYNKEKKWISMVADQIITNSFMISNYRRYPSPPPPSPRPATPKQPGISDYSEKPRPPPPSPLKSGIIISSIIKRPDEAPPPAPAASPPETMISDYGKTAKSPPPPPYTSPIIVHISSTTMDGRSSKSPPPRDIWTASISIADC